MAITWLSWIQYKRGRLDEAVDLVRRAFRVDPRDWALPFNMAEYETNLGNYRNAERWVQAAEARDSKPPVLVNTPRPDPLGGGEDERGRRRGGT